MKTDLDTPMDPSTCYRALCARDTRFDGLFYVGVTTTGIYCRPTCPARTPTRQRCEFFARAAEAERAGFRACFRCRPELAPGLAVVDSVPRLIRAATCRIESGYLNDHSIDDLAGELGVTPRHLSRTMKTVLGISPVELAQTRRLALAKQLLQDTSLPLTEVAYAAGFASIRRFNALFLERFARPPSAVRRQHGSSTAAECVALRLDYRPPLDWEALLGFLAARAIPGVERVSGAEYLRSASIENTTGWLAVGLDPGRNTVVARVSLSLSRKLMQIASRARALFDLDARPEVIASHLGQDALLEPLVVARPGLRVPGAFDGFELGVRALVGQQVSVRAATTLCGRIAQRFGVPLASGTDGVSLLFPTAEVLAAASVAQVRAVGLPEKRARSIVELARAVGEGRIDLDLRGGCDPQRLIVELQGISGIGPWTAHYIAMRALRWPNGFPASDLVVRRALGVTTARAAEQRVHDWQPWRAYGVMHLWTSWSAA